MERGQQQIEGIVEAEGEYAGMCGYCKAPDGARTSRSSVRYGLWAYELTPAAYKDMLDFGWRRSGKFLYRPYNDRCCCPQHAIRLDVRRFRPTRAQLAAMTRLRRYLDGEISAESRSAAAAADATPPKESEQFAPVQDAAAAVDASLRAALLAAFPALGPVASPVHVVTAPHPSHGDPNAVLSSSLPLAASAALRKAGVDAAAPSIAAALLERAALPAGLTASASKQGHLNFSSSALRVGFDAWLAARRAAHSSASAPAPARGPARSLDVTHKRASFTNEAFELYRRYQAAVHGEQASSPEGYRRFLVDNPFPKDSDDYGAFHQEYRIDDRLVMVGVVDVLPGGYFSSVYVFHDPDIRWLAPGIVSAMREIEWMRAHADRLALTHYVLGYYVHTCPKMLYKAAFAPAELLCSYRNEWVPYDEAIEALQGARKCFRRDADVPVLEEERRRAAATLPHALLFITQMRIVVPAAALADLQPRALQRERDDLIEYVRLLGDRLPRRIARLCTAALIGDNDGEDDDQEEEEEEEVDDEARAASTEAV